MSKRPAAHIIVAKVARWINHPDLEQSASAQIARLLVTGDPVDQHETAQDYGVTSGVVSLTAKDLETAGYRFKRTRKQGSISGHSNGLIVQMVGHTPEQRRAFNDPGAVIDLPEEDSSEVVKLPNLGQQLTVRALALTNDDAVVLMLSDGNGGAWQATITGRT